MGPQTLNLLKLHRMLNSGLPGTPLFSSIFTPRPSNSPFQPIHSLGVPSEPLPLCTGGCFQVLAPHCTLSLQNSLSEEIANMKKLQDELLLNKVGRSLVGEGQRNGAGCLGAGISLAGRD